MHSVGFELLVRNLVPHLRVGSLQSLDFLHGRLELLADTHAFTADLLLVCLKTSNTLLCTSEFLRRRVGSGLVLAHQDVGRFSLSLEGGDLLASRSWTHRHVPRRHLVQARHHSHSKALCLRCMLVGNFLGIAKSLTCSFELGSPLLMLGAKTAQLVLGSFALGALFLYLALEVLLHAVRCGDS